MDIQFNPSILITDDDQAFRETLRGMLEPCGFRTLLAGDGEEALQIVARESVHLLLLDMHMPRLTGLETLRRVQQFRAGLPCILISAGLDAALVQQALSAEAFSVLPKPISRLAITSTVEQALHRVYNWPSDHSLKRRDELLKQPDAPPSAASLNPGETAPESPDGFLRRVHRRRPPF